MIYKVYLQRRKSGMPKTEAFVLLDYDAFRNEHMPEYDRYDFANSITELKQNQYIKMYVDGGFELTNNTIILMENRFKNGLHDVIDFIAKFV
jgi:hypothetical protein